MKVAVSTTAEADLIRRAAGGDRSAFSLLVENHRRRVFFLARDLCGDGEDAEDLAQEVFVKLYRNLGSFRGDARISTWLHRVTLNTFIDLSRSRSWKERHQTGELEENSLPLSDPHARGLTPQEALVNNQQVRRQVGAALALLSPRERAAFVLRHFHEHSVRETAHSLGIREGTAKSLLFRAVRKLQAALVHLESPGSGRGDA